MLTPAGDHATRLDPPVTAVTAVTPVPPVLRDLTDLDDEDVLALNETFVDVLSPMDRTRLHYLRARADRAQAILDPEGRFAGFVLCFAGDADYDGAYFAAFRQRFGTDFYYLDRVVLGPSAQRRGLGRAAYDEIEAGAAVHGRMTLEVDIEPPNHPSLTFHAGRGYREVTRLGDDEHTAVLLEKPLGA